MKSDDAEQELYEMHRLNIELMDTLILIGFRLMDYCDRYGIDLDRRQSLETLIARAEKLVSEIGTPYCGNPIRHSSDESFHDDDPTKTTQNSPGGSVKLSADDAGC